MSVLKVAIAWPMGKEFVQQVASLSPQLHVEDIAERVRRELQLLRADPQGGETKRLTAELDLVFRDVEVLLSAFRFPNRVPERAPRLRWVQTSGAGLDRLIETARGKEGVVLTNARGMAATPMAEWVLGVMLMFAKRMPESFDNKLKRHFAFNELRTSSLAGRTVGILGLGAIGSEVARLSKALGMRVVATRKAAATRQQDVGFVDELVPPAEMLEILQGSDFVVLTLPLTAETTRIVGERELRAMKPTAYIINVGRGQLIDEPVLIRALKEGWIAGAGLDVFEKEPLPKENDLWALANVIVTPHNSASTDDYTDRVVNLFCDNLRRYMAGQPLLNVIDPSKGY